MTYPLITLPFLAFTTLVVLLTLKRPAFGRRMAASAVTAVALIALTAAFDNLMIATDLFSYPEQHLCGIRIGLAPIEDFAYSVCAAFLLPAIFTLLTPRRERAAA